MTVTSAAVVARVGKANVLEVLLLAIVATYGLAPSPVSAKACVPAVF